MCFVFPVAGLVKQIARSIFKAAKTLGNIEDSRPLMHANTTHSQAAAAHNCATGMAVDLFRRMVDRSRN
jgi:O-acetylhomoserine/O-acetylserine sulfhydrylase-like pyridoxal-dependent enzyme